MTDDPADAPGEPPDAAAAEAAAGGTGEAVPGEPPELPEGIPVWDDEYLDRASDRLLANYDLEKDYVVHGERFELYGRMEIRTEKHFLHPALSYARHRSYEHLFATRRDRVRVADLERFVDVGRDLADEWIEADEEHYGTDFTFVVIAPEITEPVEEFVSGFKERSLLKYGYHGHYEVHLAVVAPEAEEYVDSASTDVGRAFALWESVESDKKGLLGRLLG